jgi:hypothetical protein
MPGTSRPGAVNEEDDAATDPTNEAADLLDAMACRLHDAAEDLRQGARNAEAQAEVEANMEWLRGARRELAELIRAVEGPNPPQAPRRHA